ncbi:GGDEF domain-containing protein [Bordetella sp. FB-8]|uniref:GGDEF domain-containing protein n=1 Tax=Bordetella sp. FB-8 TaxID=1159870 RepID=UPI00037D7A93|nr:GGDEF domain-containing protein [Bordetella sp. FB-8]
MLTSLSILFAVMTLANFMSLAIFGSLRHAGIPGISRWMAANLLAIAGMLLYALRDASSSFLLVVLGNALFCCAIVQGYQGCRQFFRRPPAMLLPYLGLLIAIAAICYWNNIEQDFDARVVVFSIFFVCMYAGMGWLVWAHRKPKRPFYAYGFMLGVLALGVLVSVIRGVAYGIGAMHQTTLLLPTPVNIAFVFTLLLVLPALSIGMAMLAHDDMTERLEYWVNQDELTGALTRRGFFARLHAVIEQTSKASGVFSVAIVDLDHFKSINDQYGHAMGDLVLTRVGQLIVSSLREADVFGRLGGEEFVIMFPGLHRQEAASRLDILRVSLRDDYSRTVDDAVPVFTFSAGVDEYRAGEPMENLMRRADTALYAAKAQGRDRVVAADDMPSGPGPGPGPQGLPGAIDEMAGQLGIRTTIRADD